MGWIPEANVHGEAIITNPDTNVVVTHDIGATPVVGQIQVTPYDQEAAASDFWLSALGGTTFQLNVATTPTVAATFGWLYVLATESSPPPPPPPAFPVVAATNVSSNGSDTTTSQVVSLPAGIASGDLLLIALTIAAVGGWTTPTGWTLVTLADNSRSVIFGRIADGTEGASVTVTSTNTGRSAHTSQRITGQFVSASVADVVEGSWGVTATKDPPNLTPSWGSDDYLWITTVRTQRSDNTFTAPTNYGDQIGAGNTSSSSTDRCRIATATRDLTASSEDPGAWGHTGTLAAENAATYAVRPAS